MKKKYTLSGFLIFYCLFLQLHSLAIGNMEMKDSYFHRFFYKSVIMGTSSVGKYNIDFINGRNALATGFLIDFPNNLAGRLLKTENISQTAGMIIYGFEDNFGTGFLDPETNANIIKTKMSAFSLCYGWNFYNLPLGINIYTGFNIYSGNKELTLDNGTQTKDKFFAPAPYFYINKPWGSNLFTYLDAMMRTDYKDLAKIAGTILLTRMKFDTEFTTERNSSDYMDSYESSLAIQKKFGSAWFFNHVVGIFSPTMREADLENDESMKEADEILGVPGYFKIKAGTAFTVNNLAHEKFGDKIGDSGNYFGKAEFGYILGTGISYKVEEGFGWKIGFNYNINLDAAKASDSSDTGVFKLLRGKKASVVVEYYHNYICDDAFGMRIDPSMFRINLMIR